MEGGNILKNSQIIILGVCIAAATIISSSILSGGFIKVMKFTREQISVTGSAQKDIHSDMIAWRGTFSRREPGLRQAYESLKQDLEKVTKYMAEKGVAESDFSISSIVTATVYKKDEKGNDTNGIEGYTLSQSVEVWSKEVEKVAAISRESTRLIEQGVEFCSDAPQYFYTKLDELKLEMLAKASENARQRAERMVQSAGNRIGVMRSARMGVFQITPVASTDVSDYGMNDTTSYDKKVTAVVTANFGIR